MKPVFEVAGQALPANAQSQIQTPLLSQVLEASPVQVLQGQVPQGQVLIGAYLPGVEGGPAQVQVPGLPLLHVAHTLTPLGDEHRGRRLALSLLAPGQALVLGLLWEQEVQSAKPSPPTQPIQPMQLTVDGERQVIKGQKSLELRCGEAVIRLTADGHIELRGTYITSHASSTQRITGGSVHFN
jgi:hypothetical protein